VTAELTLQAFQGLAESDLSARLQSFLSETPLGLLRLARDVGRDGHEPSPALTRAAGELVSELHKVPAQSIIESMTEVLLQRNADQALQWLQEIGFIAEFFPELEATRHLRQEPGRHHKDVWEHTKLVVKQAVPRPTVRWAALLHDIGKVPTRTFTDKGVHFHGHAEVGARMFGKMQQRLPFEREMRRTLRFLIRHHLRSAQYDESWTDSAVRRFYTQMDPHLRDLLDLSRADITSKRPGRRRALLHQISALSQRIEELRKEDARGPALPKGLGTEIMKRFGVPANKELGDLMKKIVNEVESGALEREREFDYYLIWIEQSGLVSKS
jgi:poly(A) polymerase